MANAYAYIAIRVSCVLQTLLQNCNLEMARAANSSVFGPFAKVLKQSTNNFFKDDVIPGRCGPLRSAC